MDKALLGRSQRFRNPFDDQRGVSLSKWSRTRSGKFPNLHAVMRAEQQVLERGNPVAPNRGSFHGLGGRRSAGCVR